VLLWDLNYRAEEHLGFGDRPATSSGDNSAPIELRPAVMSIWVDLYNVPPSIPTDVFSKKYTFSHKNAVQSLKFLPKNYELDKRANLVQKEPSKFKVMESEP
jgi:hypothetical protein